MHLAAHTLALTSLLAHLGTSTPLAPRAIAAFPAGTVWDIVLEGGKTTLAQKKAAKGTVIDIDLEDNWANGTLTTIKELAKTKKVICYFSAGTRENWRKDDYKFTTADYGQAMGPEWPGEWWLDVKSANVRSIMKERIETAAKAGCHAVDPDNVDGYSPKDDSTTAHQDGFTYDKTVYADYIKYLAGVAKANNLAIGLKNAQGIIPNVVSVIQFAVNEQCHENKECASYKPLTDANLAVFNIEYGLNDCSDPTGVNLSTVVKNADQTLSELGGQC